MVKSWRKAALGVLVLPLILLSCSSEPEPDNMAIYRANIGKTAFNSANGAERGRIVALEVINGDADTVYQVNREGRIANAPVSGTMVRAVPSETAVTPKAIDTDVSVDPALQSAATEFRGRLARTNGQLRQFTAAGGRVVATWSSEDCSSFQSEATDLLISLNREYTETVQSIRMERTCGGKPRTLSLSGAKYNRYRSGQIGDADVFQ